MKEGTQTQSYYLKVGPLSKWRSNAKNWVKITKKLRVFKILRKFQTISKRIIFRQKRLPFHQFLIFFGIVFKDFKIRKMGVIGSVGAGWFA